MEEIPVQPEVDQSYPRSVRVLRKVDFDRIIQGGIRVADRRLSLRVLLREPGLPTRLGITVGRKAGKAVVRNRIKRLIREAFRLVRGRLPEAMDIVVFPMVKKGESPPPLQDIERSLLNLVFRARERLQRREDEIPRDDR